MDVLLGKVGLCNACFGLLLTLTQVTQQAMNYAIRWGRCLVNVLKPLIYSQIGDHNHRKLCYPAIVETTESVLLQSPLYL